MLCASRGSRRKSSTVPRIPGASGAVGPRTNNGKPCFISPTSPTTNCAPSSGGSADVPTKPLPNDRARLAASRSQPKQQACADSTGLRASVSASVSATRPSTRKPMRSARSHNGSVAAVTGTTSKLNPSAQGQRLQLGQGRHRSAAQNQLSAIEEQAAWSQLQRAQAMTYGYSLTQPAVLPQLDGSLIQKRTLRVPQTRLGDDDAAGQSCKAFRNLGERPQRIRYLDRRGEAATRSH